MVTDTDAMGKTESKACGRQNATQPCHPFIFPVVKRLWVMGTPSGHDLDVTTTESNQNEIIDTNGDGVRADKSQ